MLVYLHHPQDSVTPLMRTTNRKLVKSREFTATNDQNERISTAADFSGDTALQWPVNLQLQNRRPATRDEFKEHLREQLLNLRQKHSVQDYIQSFRSLRGQVHQMDELTQVVLFVNGFSAHIGLYVRLKHPQTVDEAIREATTYDNVMANSKNHHIKLHPLFEASPTVESNVINTRSGQNKSRFTTLFKLSTSKDDCLEYGLCFYCKEAGHRVLTCPKKQQRSSSSSHKKRKTS